MNRYLFFGRTSCPLVYFWKVLVFEDNLFLRSSSEVEKCLNFFIAALCHNFLPLKRKRDTDYDYSGYWSTKQCCPILTKYYSLFRPRRTGTDSFLSHLSWKSLHQQPTLKTSVSPVKFQIWTLLETQSKSRSHLLLKFWSHCPNDRSFTGRTRCTHPQCKTGEWQC